MEVAVSVSGAIRGDEEIAIVQIRCGGGDEPQLHGPLRQFAGDVARRVTLIAVHDPSGAGTGAGCHGDRTGSHRDRIPLGGRLGERGGLAFLDGYGSGGTGREAGTQSVAVGLADEYGLPAYHPDGTFHAGLRTGPASVAFPAVDPHDFPKHIGDREGIRVYSG